jgi:hypothetical protein
MVLSVKDMAAMLGCSEQAVYKQVYRQALLCTRPYTASNPFDG